jgi:hypothetical protein
MQRPRGPAAAVLCESLVQRIKARRHFVILLSTFSWGLIAQETRWRLKSGVRCPLTVLCGDGKALAPPPGFFANIVLEIRQATHRTAF